MCPNVTIRNRLAELDPRPGDASLYRTRDLVPAHLMPDLAKGRVLVTNWHVFEPHSMQTGGVSARVLKAGVRKRIREFITIGPKTTMARGKRYLTLEEVERQRAAGLIEILDEELDPTGNLKRVYVEAERHVESDTAVVNRGDASGKAVLQQRAAVIDGARPPRKCRSEPVSRWPKRAGTGFRTPT